ncbi:MAG: helix-turn-helix transcriptional regulator [Clostridia bacterium]|nr:helix-turn-helix transcriptional regulator [Clostridia bacterium]
MKELREAIAEKIASLRRANKMTQAELAEKLNYSDKSVSKWERGEALPDIEVLVALSELFNVSLDYLVSDKEFKPQPLSKSQKQNRAIISGLAVLTVWVIATLIFVFCQMFAHIAPWIVFIWAIPASSIVAIVFNGIWGKHWVTFLLCSVLVWSVIASFYFQFLFFFEPSFNLWQMFIAGLPVQVVIILWSRLRRATSAKK